MLGRQDDTGPLGFQEPLLLTAAYAEWEKEYLVRVAQQIHRLVCAELDRREEALFMLFTQYDENLDGRISQGEIWALIKQVCSTESHKEADEIVAQLDVDGDGYISFLELLRWWNSEDEHDNALSGTRFGIVAAVVGLVGSGYLQTDDRIRSLDTEMLRRNIVGYKKILRQIADHKVSVKLEKVRQMEEDECLSAPQAISRYHDLLFEDLDGDCALLFYLLTLSCFSLIFF
jgi:hypothetical protein